VGSVEFKILAGNIPGNLRFEIADTGPGIDEADPLEDAGLGLAITARVVGLMGGTIGHGPNAGGGNVFWVELPPGEVVASLPATMELGPGSPLSGVINVLLVDDIAMNRNITGAFLRNAGHQVTLAESGRDAVRLAGEQTFDVILMDVRMPEMDGMEATRLIRALLGRHALVPILALTAYSFPEQVARCQEAGMDGHVSKPVDYATLLQAIANVMARVPS
jgi:CheY-like chemotaxis protein